jgi:hypothetical protein
MLYNQLIISISINTKLFIQGENMNIKGLKLITGEDVVAEIESESETEFVLLNTVGITVIRGKDGQPNVGFSPFPIHAEQVSGATLVISKRNVVYSYTPAEEFTKHYEQLFGAGLIVPPTPKIITG